FPEEPLNLSAADGFGYFPAEINQTLNGGDYTILRKLGWGPRSSTWLAKEADGDRTLHFAVQAFTVATSKEVEARVLPIFQTKLSAGNWILFPYFYESFWEKSVHGEHLCLALGAYGLPFSDVLRDAANGGRAGLSVHVVQYTSSCLLQTLTRLHDIKVMHG
ncbi:hypothetical protein DFP72DRAFT_761149, partial [Ephemerocybe angulata]